jgi:hypothetical protein
MKRKSPTFGLIVLGLACLVLPSRMIGDRPGNHLLLADAVIASASSTYQMTLPVGSADPDRNRGFFMI